MAKYASFRELIVWQKGMDLAEAAYRATQELPATETYELGRQLRRSAASIPANVAEGFCRHSRAAYRHHISIALGSNAEFQTHLELAKRLSLLAEDLVERLEDLTAEVGRLLNGLWRALSPVAVCYSVMLGTLSGLAALVRFSLRVGS